MANYTSSYTGEQIDQAVGAILGSIVSRTESYALSLTDSGTVQKCSSSSTITVTIPLNSSVAFPVGAEVVFMRYGFGAVTLSPADGVTLYSSDSKKSIAKRYEALTIKQMAIDEWIAVGSLTT